MRQGVRLAIDYGNVRIGIARSDITGLLASPLLTIPTVASDRLEQIKQLVESESVIEVIVGLPISLSGNSTASTQSSLEFAVELSSIIEIPIRMLDERLTTVSAQSQLRSSGKKTKGTRSIIDQVAAVVLLQQALEYERNTGQPAGRLVAHEENS